MNVEFCIPARAWFIGGEQFILLLWINLLDVALRWIDLTIYSIHSFLRVKRDSYLSELELLASVELFLLTILEDPARIARQAGFNLLNLIHQ